MKKTLIILVILTVIVVCSCKKEETYVFTGQLYYAVNHGIPEKLHGKVKEYKLMSYWAKIEDGKVVKGNMYTNEDRKTTPLSNDFIEEYNPYGTVLKTTAYADSGKVSSYWTTETDGKIIKKATYFYHDTARGYTQYTYDGDLMKEVRAYNLKNDTLLASVRYEYDQNGNRVKFQTFDQKNNSGVYALYTYDDMGNLTKIQGYNNKDGKQTYQFDYTYNNKGVKTGHHQQDLVSGKIIDYTFDYEFDKMGNFTKVIFLKDGKPYLYRERIFKYYE